MQRRRGNSEETCPCFSRGYTSEYTGTHNEEAHNWGFTADQKSALSYKWTTAQSMARYRVALMRRVGIVPRSGTPTVTKAGPHSNCFCSALCRAYRQKMLTNPITLAARRQRWQQLKTVGTLAAIGWR